MTFLLVVEFFQLLHCYDHNAGICRQTVSNIPNIKRYEITYTKAQLLYPTTARKEERYKERGLAEGKKKRGKGCPGDEEDWSTYRLRKRYIKSSSCRQNDIQLHILLISLDGYLLKLCPLQTSPTLEY